MKKLLLVLLSVMFILALSGCKSDTDDTEPEETESPFIIAPEEDFEYVVNGDRVNIKKYIGNESVVVIPARIEGLRIGRIAVDFLEDSGVTEITFPSYFTEFTGVSKCGSLEIIHLPSMLGKIPEPFRFCPNLKEIDIEEGGAYKTEDGALYTADGKTLAAYPCGRTGSFTVPAGVEEIEKFAFSNSSLSEIILPDTLKTINEYGFLDAKKLDKITVPPSVRFIGYSAFSGSGIREVVLSEGLEEIESSAFEKTDIKELYIPDSVIKCGNYLADDDVHISASYPVKGMENLTQRENVTFRDETLLEEAFRIAEKELLNNSGEILETKGTVFADLTGDNFPEAVQLINDNTLYFYCYDYGAKRWKTDWSMYRYGYYGHVNIPVYDLYYDSDADTYTCCSDAHDYYRYDSRYWDGKEPTELKLVQHCVSFAENEVVLYDLFDDEIRKLADTEIIKTLDVNEMLSRYNFDLNDNYNKFVIVADSFSERPNGSLFEKSLTVNGKEISEYPYYESFYPDNIKLTAAGADIIRGEKLDGVYYRDNTLVLDNAVIDANGESFIIRASGIGTLTVELIGDSKVVSDSPCSLFYTGNAKIVFKGNGSLETPKIETMSSVTLTESARLIESRQIPSSPADSYSFETKSFSLTDDSYMECRYLSADSLYLSENSHAEIKIGEIGDLTLSGSSSMNIINDLPDNSYRGGAAINEVGKLTISDNARLYADNSGQNDDTIYFYYGSSIMTISGNGILEINGNPHSFGVNLDSNWGTLTVNDNGSVIINGSSVCMIARKIVLNGGTMELNSGEGGVAIAMNPDVSANEDYIINGEIISENPKGREFRKYEWTECMAFGEGWVRNYFVSVKQKESEE